MSVRWTEERIRRELERFLPGHDRWPSYRDFRAAGRRGLWQAIARCGGPERFAAEYGLRHEPAAQALTDADVRAALRTALRGSDLAAWPSRRWLRERSGPRVLDAIERTGGAARWSAELALPLTHIHRERWSDETIAAALESLLAGRRTWPNRREFRAARLAGLYQVITERYGHAELAARYALPLQRPGRRRTSPRAPSLDGEEGQPMRLAPPLRDHRNT